MTPDEKEEIKSLVIKYRRDCFDLHKDMNAQIEMTRKIAARNQETLARVLHRRLAYRGITYDEAMVIAGEVVQDGD